MTPTITTKNVEQLLLEATRPLTLWQIVREFKCSKPTHEERLRGLLEKLVALGTIIRINGHSTAAKSIGSDLCELFDLNVYEIHYTHRLKKFTEIKIEAYHE